MWFIKVRSSSRSLVLSQPRRIYTTDLTENITENDNNCSTNDDEDVHSLELNEDFVDFSINEINEE
jgi:hypothetical protein